ncbi:MAG: prepilin peptidase [Alphaproteobacteria bacterium]|nr:prepilin peptidase [Alphaproteobacteria bacterium]
MQPIDLQGITHWVLPLAALLGACIGSFITLISYRLPRDEKVGATRSRCPKCGAQLAARDLLPVLSWVVNFGKCRHCRAAISSRYIITELLCAIGAAAILYRYGELSYVTIAYIGLWFVSVAIILTDLEHYLILDEYQIALALFGIVFAYTQDMNALTIITTMSIALVGSICVKYLFLLITKRDGLGWGDIKLFGVVSIWLPHAIHFAPLLVFAGVLGVASACIWRALGKGEVFPFGPAIILSLLVFIFMPEAYATFWQLYGIKMQFLHP